MWTPTKTSAEESAYVGWIYRGYHYRGFIVFKTRKNYATILAVLLVLPAAKTLVAYIIMIPFKTDKQEYYQEVSKLINDKMTLLSDLVVTKYEGVMMYSLVVIIQGNVYAFVHPQKIKVNQLKSYDYDCPAVRGGSGCGDF